MTLKELIEKLEAYELDMREVHNSEEHRRSELERVSALRLRALTPTDAEKALLHVLNWRKDFISIEKPFH